MSDRECPECGQWKGEDYEFCRDCSTSKFEAGRELVSVSYFDRAHETEKAVLFKMEPGLQAKTKWVPKSLLGREEEGRFFVPRWFAEKEGFLID